MTTENTARTAARIVRAHELRLTPSPSGTIARAVIDAIADSGLEGGPGGPPPADVVVLVVAPGKGNGALNVALAAVEADLRGTVVAAP